MLRHDLSQRLPEPPLPNVELTGPYGHEGAFIGLHDFIDHYSESDLKLRNFDVTQLEPHLRGAVLPTVEEILSRPGACWTR